MRDLASSPMSCAINTATLGFQAPIAETIEAVARAGFGGIGPWRREIEGQDVAAIGRHIRDAGLVLTGYCRSSFIPANTKATFDANVADNMRAIEDAAALGAHHFVMVVGGLPEGSRDLAAARHQVADACGLLAARARDLGVRLALEPLHPVHAADRSCLNLLSQALDLCDALEGQTADPWIGTAIDVHHVWWDPNLANSIARAGNARRIFGFHVCDWLVPAEDPLNDRGMMGDGVIDLPAIRAKVEGAGYSGPVEAEIFSVKNWWRRPVAETLEVCRQRFAASC